MPFYDVNITEKVSSDFLEYAGHVMQERSIPDARDCLKDGARKILYIQFRDKNTHEKNFIKGAAAVGQILKDGFLHGDQSAYSTLVRMGKKFAVPYVYQEIQGNGGNQVSPDNHASSRYLEIRQTELASYLFNGIDKNSINEWYWNYANTLELPRVLPTIGFYPIVNGVAGIAVGLSSSIPPTNLKEVNKAIIKLIQNPEISFDEIYCAPDFPMGGTILNGDEVKESFRAGSGSAVKMRAKIEYNSSKNMLIATEIPFSVYTETIDEELRQIINEDEKCGINKFIDATNDDGARLHIYLEKGANVKKVINLLYRKTSLQSFYGINMIMLDNGRFPKVFSWKDALQAYITHIRACKRRETQFDLDKALARQNIVEGLIKASASIDDIVALIRASANPADAQTALVSTYGFNDEQAKAILAMKLSSLTKIDAVKLNDEMAELADKIQEMEDILHYPDKLDAELIKVLQEVADKFGDKRRTVILNVPEEEEEESDEEKQVCVFVFSNNEVRVGNPDKIASAKKGRKGKPIPTPRGASLVDTLYSSNLSNFYAITKSGKMYAFPISEIEEDVDTSLYQLGLGANEEVVKIFASDGLELSKYIVFATKNGMIKRTETSEYKSCFNRGGIAAIKLRDDDEVISCFCSSNDEDQVYMATAGGFIARFKMEQVSITGRVSLGVKGIKGEVVSAGCAYAGKSYKGFLSLSSSGKGKISVVETVPLTNRAVRGVSLQKIEDGEELVCVELVEDGEKEIKLLAGNKVVSLSLDEIASRGRVAMGSKLIDIKGQKVKITVLRR